jgi:hypothetical protein
MCLPGTSVVPVRLRTIALYCGNAHPAKVTYRSLAIDKDVMAVGILPASLTLNSDTRGIFDSF